MQQTTSTQDIVELELALNKSRQVPGFRALLVFFWALIVAKCLLLQWAAQTYHAPINTFWFVWVPSCLISGAITLGYAYWLFRELPRMPLSGRLVSATWVACATGFGLLALVAGAFDAFNIYLLPALAAILLGVGGYIQSVVDHSRLYQALAIGWWVAALGLFTQPNVNALGWMSVCLAILLVLPAGCLFFQRKRQA